MMKLFVLVCLASVGTCSEIRRKRGLADWGVGMISNLGSAILPEATMRTGCASVGLYNREKDGSPPRRDASGGILGAAGGAAAKFGDVVFSRSGMEQGCINAGFYDRNLDDEGNPLGANGQKVQQPVFIPNQQQQRPILVVGGQQPTKKFKCFVNGVEGPCDQRHIQQIQQG